MALTDSSFFISSKFFRILLGYSLHRLVAVPFFMWSFQASFNSPFSYKYFNSVTFVVIYFEVFFPRYPLYSVSCYMWIILVLHFRGQAYSLFRIQGFFTLFTVFQPLFLYTVGRPVLVQVVQLCGILITCCFLQCSLYVLILSDIISTPKFDSYIIA